MYEATGVGRPEGGRRAVAVATATDAGPYLSHAPFPNRMDPDLSALDAFLDEQATDGYLVHADSTDSTQYYLSGFDAPDPFVTLYDG